MSRRICTDSAVLLARRAYVAAEVSRYGLSCGLVRYPAGFELSAHAHARPTVTVVVAGLHRESRGRSGKSSDCSAGYAVLRSPGELHANVVGPAGVSNLELELDPRRVEVDATSATWGAQARADLAPLARRIAAELLASGQRRSLLVEGLALELIALALEAPRVAQPRGAPPWLARAHARVREESRSNVTVAELARDAGVHPVYFARAFRARYGVGPAEVMRMARLEWAAQALLDEPQRSIAAIAQDAGFFDQSHFNRAFRAATGLSPARYRLRLVPARGGSAGRRR